MIETLQNKKSDKRLTLRSRITLTLSGIALILLFWQILSFYMPGLVLASPLETFAALGKMSLSASFWHQIWSSFRRILLGISFGSIAGFTLGLFSGLNIRIRYLIEPLRWMLMSVPAVVVVVIAMLWFGMGSTMVVFITSILLAPIVYVNTVRGFDLVDENVIEMAQVYRFSRWQTVRHIYIPAVVSHVVSAMVIATGMGVRIVILAEVMGTSEGIGHSLALARSTIETAELFAWVIVCIGIVGVIEYLLIRPVEKRILRWKS